MSLYDTYIVTLVYMCTLCMYALGPEFEGRIRLNEAGNTKFNFLNPHDPYHAYYRHKIVEIQEGVAQEAAAAASQQQAGLKVREGEGGGVGGKVVSGHVCVCVYLSRGLGVILIFFVLNGVNQ